MRPTTTPISCPLSIIMIAFSSPVGKMPTSRPTSRARGSSCESEAADRTAAEAAMGRVQAGLAVNVAARDVMTRGGHRMTPPRDRQGGRAAASVEDVEDVAILQDEFAAGGRRAVEALVDLVVDEEQSRIGRLQPREAQVRRQHAA